MGIKDLWSILTPFCERRPLYELQNKKVAIDLSCWVCEAQNVTDYSVQPRMYLRNLYFRTCYLLLMGVMPVFVLEGKAPQLKYETIAARNAIQFKGAKPKDKVAHKGKDRSRFNYTLRQCQDLLSCMGLVCVKGIGEAEAMCAYLNEDNLVDGIISQDSDCFAYGAKVVYRNFSISHQGPKGGSMDVYDISKAYQDLNFGRNKIIALALLCGSDYGDGVHGIGKDSVLKLFDKVADKDILDRLRSWRNEHSLYKELESKIESTNVCTSCGHNGKVQAHNRTGCKDCHTTKGCDFAKFKTERLVIKNEINMRRKALQDPDFPNESLVQEFLTRKDNVAKLDLNWKQPKLIEFVKFAGKYLSWAEIYAFEKFIPILTRWQLLNRSIFINDDGKQIEGIVCPQRIKKSRTLKGVPSYEIVWHDPDNNFAGLLPPSQLEGAEDLEKLWSTCEPQDLFGNAYPEIEQQFLLSKHKPSKRRQKSQDIDKLMQNCSISEPAVKKPRKKPNGKLQTLDLFVKKSDRHNSTFIDLDLSKFGDENDLDVSDIIDDITNRKMPQVIRENVHKYADLLAAQNNSSFFITELVENDLFEQTFNDGHSTDECSGDYSKDLEYVPLYERLTKKNED